MPRPLQTGIITETVVADVTTQTAADTLRHDLGLGQRLVSLKRKDIWLFRLSLEDKDACVEFTTRLAENTKLFVNPNKHRYSVVAMPMGTIPPDPVKVDDGVYQFTFVVRFREDFRGIAAKEDLNRLYKVGGEVESIDTGMLWEIQLRATSDDDAMETFQRVLVAKDRKTGLFVNPHSQTVVFPDLTAVAMA